MRLIAATLVLAGVGLIAGCGEASRTEPKKPVDAKPAPVDTKPTDTKPVEKPAGEAPKQ